MKVTVLQENLTRGLSIVSRAVSPRSTLPVLANVLIASDEGRLRLSATNLELGITCWIAAKVTEDGSTTVPARTLSDLVNTLPDSQVQLSLDAASQTLNIRSGRSNNDIKCIDAQEFPPMPVPEMNKAIQINVADFKEISKEACHGLLKLLALLFGGFVLWFDVRSRGLLLRQCQFFTICFTLNRLQIRQWETVSL